MGGGGGSSLPALGGHGPALTGSRVDDKLIDDHLAVQAIIRSYQVTFRGSSSLWGISFASLGKMEWSIQLTMRDCSVLFFIGYRRHKYYLTPSAGRKTSFRHMHVLSDINSFSHQILSFKISFLKSVRLSLLPSSLPCTLIANCIQCNLLTQVCNSIKAHNLIFI